ncbi:MAG: FxLYD domain-containing protein [Cyanobacteria bacterium P01_B01_bin.77]
MGRDLIIEQYIQRLLDWEEPVTAETLTALAQEAGLGPDELAAVQKKAQDHLERGRNYLDFDCLDDAIDELTQATTLDPLNFEGLQSLTYAYDQRYGKQKDPADKAQAIVLAKRCLELKPSDEDAVILISSLEQEVADRQRLLWLGLAVLVIAIGFKPVMDIITTRSEVAQLTAAIAPESSTEPAPIESSEGITATIPIQFEQPDLTLDPRQSRLDNYEDASYYTLQAVLLNTSDQEIDALQLQIEYLDDAGNAIATDSKDAIADNNATVRPGDHHAFDLIHKTTPDLASIRLSVTTLDQVPAPETYATAPTIPYTWGITQPGQLSFDLTARRESLDVYDLTDSAYFDADWAVTNTSDTAIRQLKLQANFYDAQNKLILSEDILAVYGSDAPMLPDETRPIRVIKSIDKDYTRYDVKVVEAK